MTGLLFDRFIAMPMLVLTLFLIAPGSSTAAPVEGLYESVVPVVGQEADQRSDAIQKAFRQMLIKVTGSRAVVSQDGLKDLWGKASRYVQQYRYEQLPESASTDADSSNPDTPDRLLRVTFDAQAVSGLLKERHMVVWGENRPSSLIWLGLEQSGKRRWGMPDGDATLYAALGKGAEERGLPLVFPLMDLEDQAGLQISDLWGDFEQNIRRASDRYSPDVIVTGRLLNIATGRWRAFWRLYQGDRVSSWTDEAVSSNQLAENGVQHAVDLLAERFAPLAGAGNLSRVRLQVSGISDLTIYSRVEKFINSQSAVEKSALTEAGPSTLTFELQVRGGLQALQEGLQLGGLIEPSGETAGTESLDSAGIDLFYTIR